MSRRMLLLVSGVSSVLFVAGCGGGGRAPVEPVVPVEGTLLIDGEPLDGVVVTFIPENSKEAKLRRGGSGKTDESGAFTVTDLGQNKPGLPPGRYLLAYSRMRLPDGSAKPEPQAGTPPADDGVVQVETLPEHLQTPDPNEMSNWLEIPEDGITDLELKASTKAPAAGGPK